MNASSASSIDLQLDAHGIAFCLEPTIRHFERQTVVTVCVVIKDNEALAS